MPAEKPKTEGKKRVKCLGPVEPDHWFYTPNLDGSNRICPACREKQKSLNLSPQCGRADTLIMGTYEEYQ